MLLFWKDVCFYICKYQSKKYINNLLETQNCVLNYDLLVKIDNPATKYIAYLHFIMLTKINRKT